VSVRVIAKRPDTIVSFRNRDVVKVLLRLAEDIMFEGPSPIRVGQFPKALLAFSTELPFDKVVSRWFALPGEDYTAEGFKGCPAGP
jgi:hypothetical protein